MGRDQKEDCGHSYFSDKLIVHNTWVPFKTGDWEIKESFIEDEVKPFKFAYYNLKITTELYRPKDGAKALVSSFIMISAPWLGGPIANVMDKRSGSWYGKNFDDYYYENGEILTIEYTYTKDYEYQLLPHVERNNSEIIIPPNIIMKAITKVNDQFQDYFKSREVVYFESESPGYLTTFLPTKWKNQYNLRATTVIALALDFI